MFPFYIFSKVLLCIKLVGTVDSSVMGGGVVRGGGAGVVTFDPGREGVEVLSKGGKVLSSGEGGRCCPR